MRLLVFSILVVVLTLSIFQCQTSIEEDNKKWHALHGICLKWVVTRHVPVHGYRCDKWEKWEK